mmetsp:Transcript_35659/g.89965  ORF Transcript_35659/g.89965 Transcript_35659/m.89965 type:complete len:225 (+) Transcript_35659:4982-5656(+)
MPVLLLQERGRLRTRILRGFLFLVHKDKSRSRSRKPLGLGPPPKNQRGNLGRRGRQRSLGRRGRQSSSQRVAEWVRTRRTHPALPSLSWGSQVPEFLNSKMLLSVMIWSISLHRHSTPRGWVTYLTRQQRRLAQCGTRNSMMFRRRPHQRLTILTASVPFFGCRAISCPARASASTSTSSRRLFPASSPPRIVGHSTTSPPSSTLPPRPLLGACTRCCESWRTR